MPRSSEPTPPTREIAPYMWILGPGNDPDNSEHWEFVGRTGYQYVHDELVTYHIGVNESGLLICDSRKKEYTPGHPFYGNKAIDCLPPQVLRDALSASLDINIAFIQRQRFIKALATKLPEFCKTQLDFPEPVITESMLEELNIVRTDQQLLNATKTALAALRHSLGFIGR